MLRVNSDLLLCMISLSVPDPRPGGQGDDAEDAELECGNDTGARGRNASHAHPTRGTAYTKTKLLVFTAANCSVIVDRSVQSRLI